MKKNEKPLCCYCNRKPAKTLGEFRSPLYTRPVFCSWKCAGKQGLSGATDMGWCAECGTWTRYDAKGACVDSEYHVSRKEAV
jgi:hypothetical protein